MCEIRAKSEPSGRKGLRSGRMGAPAEREALVRSRAEAGPESLGSPLGGRRTFGGRFKHRLVIFHRFSLN